MDGGRPRVALLKRRILLVEGSEEVAWLRGLEGRGEWLAAVQVIAFAGKDNLSSALAALVRDPGFADIVSIGVLRDADDSPENALASVRGALSRQGLPALERSGAFDGTAPRVGVFIVPGGDAPGMLETLCWQSVADTPAGRCVTAMEQCLGEARPAGHQLDKFRVSAWLAAQERPGLRLGEAGQKGLWDYDHPAFAPLIAFLRELAGASELG